MTKSVNVDVKVPYVRCITEFDKGGQHNHIKFVVHGTKTRDWDLAKISADNLQYAKVDRVRAKGLDCFAGKAADPVIVLQSLDAMFLRLQTDDWNEGKKGGFGGVADLIHAVADQHGKTLDEIQKLYDGADETRRKGWRDNADIQMRIKRIQLDRAEKRAVGCKTVTL